MQDGYKNFLTAKHTTALFWKNPDEPNVWEVGMTLKNNQLYKK